jgi:large conductance mechanosensitive channel
MRDPMIALDGRRPTYYRRPVRSLGAARGSVVTSLVDDVIMPPVGRVIGGVDSAALQIDLGGGAAIRYGAFINSVI